jgi:flagellar hook-associated protein 3 FlgL
MSIRIGDLVHNRQLAASLGATQARTRAAESAIASGQAATRYAAIADEAGTLLRARDAQALKSGYLEQAKQVGQRIETMDAAMDGLVGIAQRARAALVQRLDGASGKDMPLATELEGMLADVAAKLNTKLGSEHLFAGSRTDTAPVALPATPITAADPTLYYQGDAVRLGARIDEGVEIAWGVTADDPAFAGLIASLGQAAAAHAADDRSGLEAALAGLDQALDGMIDLRSAIGAQAARTEAAAEAHEAGIDYLGGIVSGIADADVPTVMARLAQDQASLEATYAVTGRLASLSLADYLR